MRLITRAPWRWRCKLGQTSRLAQKGSATGQKTMQDGADTCTQSLANLTAGQDARSNLDLLLQHEFRPSVTQCLPGENKISTGGTHTEQNEGRRKEQQHDQNKKLRRGSIMLGAMLLLHQALPHSLGIDFQEG